MAGKAVSDISQQQNLRKFKVALNPFVIKYSPKSSFLEIGVTERFLRIRTYKLESRVFLTDFTVALVSYCHEDDHNEACVCVIPIS